MCIKIFRHWAIGSISKNPWAITFESFGNCPMALPLTTPLALTNERELGLKLLKRPTHSPAVFSMMTYESLTCYPICNTNKRCLHNAHCLLTELNENSADKISFGAR